MIAMICTCVATLGVTALVWYLERREWRMKGRIRNGTRSGRESGDVTEHVGHDRGVGAGEVLVHDEADDLVGVEVVVVSAQIVDVFQVANLDGLASVGGEVENDVVSLANRHELEP